MAEALKYQVPPREAGDPAREELDQLIHSLHEQGLLRLANNALRASPEVGEIILKQLNKPEAVAGMQNLLVLATALGSIPPERLATVVDALSSAMNGMAEATDDDRRSPGLLGSLAILRDEHLWAGIGPLLAGLRRFGDSLRAPSKKPIERFSSGVGKGFGRSRPDRKQE